MECTNGGRMIDFIVKRLLVIIGEGGTECGFAYNQILDIIHTLENEYGYEVPNTIEEG
jgi:hypothetical protein